MPRIEIDFGANFEKYMKDFSEAQRKTVSGIGDIQNMFKAVAGVSLFGYGIRELFNFGAECVKSAAQLEVLRNNFRGTSQDIELFRKATAGTVTEAGLLKLSNQATDLGLSIQQQAILMSMAEDAADKYGGSVEENFSKIINATEGATKGLKYLGIQKAEYDKLVKKYVEDAGAKQLEQLDAETQKWIQVEAMIKIAGVTMEDVTGKIADNADKLDQLSVAWEEFKTKFGQSISELYYITVGMLSGKSFNQLILEQIAERQKANDKKALQNAIDEAEQNAKILIRGKTKAQIKAIRDEQKALVDANTLLKVTPGSITAEDIEFMKKTAIAQLNVYDEALSKKPPKADKQKELIQTDEIIKKELARVEAELKGNISARERNELLKIRLELEEKLYGYDRAIAMTDAAKGANLSGEPTQIIPQRLLKDLPIIAKEQHGNKPTMDLGIGEAWEDAAYASRSAVNTMVQGLSRVIARGEDLGDTIKDIGASWLETGLAMLFSIGAKALLTELGVPSFLFANGGVIAEPVLGVGINSRKSYVFGESGNEIVMPANRYASGGGGVVVKNYFNVSNEVDGFKLRTLIKKVETLESRMT